MSAERNVCQPQLTLQINRLVARTSNFGGGHLEHLGASSLTGAAGRRALGPIGPVRSGAHILGARQAGAGSILGQLGAGLAAVGRVSEDVAGAGLSALTAGSGALTRQDTKRT